MTAALRSRWPLRLAAGVAVAVALFALFGYLAAPALLRDLVQERLTQELARPVQVERVEVRPFALAATLHNLVVTARDGTPQFAVEAIEADASLASLWHRAPILDRLRVVRPHLAFARIDATRYDVSDLLDRWLAPSSDPTPRFSLNNVEIVQGRIAFDDRPLQRRHAVEALDVGVPFLSSLPYHTDIDVQPKLAAVVNGTRFALTGQAKPYAERREATLSVDVDALPLAQYVDYLPLKLRAALAGGALTTRLAVTFAQLAGAPPEVAVAGTLALAGLDVRRSDGAPLANVRDVQVTLERLDLASRTVRIASVLFDAPVLAVRRLRSGEVELAGPWMESRGPASASTADEKPWRVEVGQLTVKAGRASVEDMSVSPSYQAVLTEVEATGARLANGPERSGEVAVSLRIDGEAAASLQAKVALAPFAMEGRFDVTNARLARLYPYAAGALDLAIQRGSGDYASAFEWTPQGELKLAGGKATVRDLALAAPGEREPLWRMPELAVEGIDVEVAKRSVEVAAVTMRRPQATLARDARGEWNVARLMRTTATTGTANAGAEPTWQLRVAKAAVDRGEVRLSDATMTPPLALGLSEIALAATDVGNARDRRSTLDLRARVEREGRIALKGPFTSNPFSAALDVQAERLPLLAAKALIEREANLILVSGTAGGRGRLEATPDAGGALRYAWNGDVVLADVETLDPPTGGRLFAWRRLALDKLAARSEPVEASVAALSIADFYARLIVYADGTVNLARLAKRGEEPAASSAAKATKPASGAVASAAHTAERTMRRAVDGALPIAVGRIELANGNVNFSDFFVRPNYSANLTQVAGTVSALSPTQAGEVALTAKVDDAAPVTISGSVQPFARELALALAARARDIELAPLSPYAVKYAGYGITKGKLSFDVDYTIAQRKLDAKNRLVLDQLTFGDRVESPEATKLPVLLAVALLKDAQRRHRHRPADQRHARRPAVFGLGG